MNYANLSTETEQLARQVKLRSVIKQIEDKRPNKYTREM